jgi:hypothetical protein
MDQVDVTLILAAVQEVAAVVPAEACILLPVRSLGMAPLRPEEVMEGMRNVMAAAVEEEGFLSIIKPCMPIPAHCLLRRGVLAQGEKMEQYILEGQQQILGRF